MKIFIHPILVEFYKHSLSTRRVLSQFQNSWSTKFQQSLDKTQHNIHQRSAKLVILNQTWTVPPNND